MSIHVFLPCRKGSERIPKKNIMPFANHPFGLISIKIHQLLKSSFIDEIVLTSNDEDILQYVTSINDSRIRIHHRVEELSSSSTSTDSLVQHAVDLIPSGDILWTHVTSPFVNSNVYDDVINKYNEVIKQGFDSLMTVNEIQSFLWDKKSPLNYDRAIEKWPRTQTLEPIYEVNSAVFLANSNIYRHFSDRIGQTPYLYTLDKIRSFDIDWPEDFSIAQAIVKDGIVSL